MQILNLWEDSEFVSGFKYVRFLNIPRLSICQGWISRVTQGLPIFVNMTGFRMCWDAIMEGFMPGFFCATVTQGSEYGLVMPE